MSFAFGKQIAYCYRRAAECRELARRCCAIDQEHYFQREQAWLKLARSYESQQRADRRLTELELSVGCFSVQIACAAFISLLSAEEQILASRTAELPISPMISIVPSQDPAARGTRRQRSG
jgi:hypothetical protein